MSTENIEKYFQDLEAIKNYAAAKVEKEELSYKVEELKVSLDNALKEVASLKTSKAKLDGADMTLEEARLDFIRAQDGEVEKSVADRFDKLKADYEARMPQLVCQRLSDTLKQSAWPAEIAKLIDIEAKKQADAILRGPSCWPDWFRKLYQEQIEKKVSAGLNQEFNARVETAVTARAEQKLTELTNREWPAWYQANVAPKIAELENKIYAGAIELLKGPWTLTCDRCATSSNYGLTAEGIVQMLQNGQVKVECGNPDCVDNGFFSSGRHTFSVSLRRLIEIRTM